MVNTPWIFRGREAIWRHGLQCDYPTYDGPRLTSWSRNFKEFGVEHRDGVGVPMKEDEGKKKIMVISHRQNYPPASLSDTCTSNSEFTTISYPPQKPKIIFVSPKLPSPSAVNSCPHPLPLCTGSTEGGHLGPPPSLSLLKAAREFAEDLSVSSFIHKSRGPDGTSPAPLYNK